MKNKLLIISILSILVFTGCEKRDAEPVVSEPVETEVVEGTKPVEENEKEQVSAKTDSTAMDELTLKYENVLGLYNRVMETLEATDELEQLFDELNSIYDVMISDRGLSNEEISVNSMLLDNIESQLESMIATPSEKVSDDEIPLTQEEIDELKSKATTSDDLMFLEMYEQITQKGSYTNQAGTLDKAVGKPDASWRKMTDAEAQAIIAQGKDAEGYWVAVNELKDKSWHCIVGDTVYYDYYAWFEEVASKSVVIEHDIELVESDDEYWSSID